jgi:DNA-binding MarR family transcriptional regulator
MQPDDAALTRLMYLLDVIRGRFADDIREELGDHPYRDVRRSELRLLLLIPTAGTTLSTLSGLAGVTKQSLSEFVDRLERAGYVASQISVRDRRVKLIRPTPRGEAARKDILSAALRVEQAWRTEVQPDRFDSMKSVLAQLADGGDRTGSIRGVNRS